MFAVVAVSFWRGERYWWVVMTWGRQKWCVEWGLVVAAPTVGRLEREIATRRFMDDGPRVRGTKDEKFDHSGTIRNTEM